MAKWITIEGREHPLLIHGTYDLEVGDRVTVFPLKGDKISAATAKGLPIEPGARVVVVPHERYPGSQIYRSIFGNDEMAPHIHIGNIGEYQIIFVDEYADFHAEITSNPPLQSQTWNFGDWQSGSLNTSWDANPSHQYRHPGWYNVRLTARNQHLSDTVTWESAVRVEVPPPTSLSASNVGSGRVRVSWTPGIPNESCKVMVRTDMYPPHPNNGTIIYWGQATSLELNLTPGTRYYFRVWGIYEGVFSEGYQSSSLVVRSDIIPPGTYYLDRINDYHIGGGGSSTTVGNMLGHNNNCTLLGDYGWVEASWDSVSSISQIKEVTIAEGTGGIRLYKINPNNYIHPSSYSLITGVDNYAISFKEPNIIRIRVTTAGGFSEPTPAAYGNIVWVSALIE